MLMEPKTPQPDSNALEPREWWVLLGIVLATLAILWSAGRAPMYDAPNHIAAGVIYQRLQSGDNFTAAHYTMDPIPVPYWLTTLGMYALRGFDPHVAFRILLSAFAILVPLSFWLLARRVSPKALRFTPLVALTVFGSGYWSGESNYFFGQPLTVLALVCFFSARRVKSYAMLGFGVSAVLVYLGHIFDLCALLGTLLVFAALHLGRKFVPKLPSLPWTRAQTFCLVITGLLFAAAVHFVFLDHGTSANRGTFLFDWNPRRLGNVFEESLTSPTLLSPGPALALLATLLLLWASTISRAPGTPWHSRFTSRIHLPFLIAAGSFAALYFFGPVGLLEEGGRDEEDICQRFGWISLLLFLLALRFDLGPRRRQIWLAALVAFAALKLSDASSIHRRVSAAREELAVAVLSHVPENSRVLTINKARPAGARKWEYFFLYAGSDVVVDRKGYVPAIFARAGQQPLRHKFGGEHRQIFKQEISTEEWDYYDYVLVQTKSERPAIPGLLERTREVAHGAEFRLYRVERPVSWGDAENEDSPRGGADPG